MRRDPIAPIFFQNNRERLAASVPAQALIVIRGNTTVPRTDGLSYPFHQNSDFYYFTGCNIEDCALLILTDESGRIREECFFHPSSENLELVWTGRLNRLTQTLRSTRFKSLHTTDEFEQKLNSLSSLSKVLIIDDKQDYNLPEYCRIDSTDFLETSKDEFPLEQYSKEQRAIKQTVEIALMQRASQITAVGFERILGLLKAGSFEYELEAKLVQCFLSNQADGFAYPPIIASGISGILLHYQENSQMLRAGDLVLLDIGASYANYKADITRVFPVSGRFSSRQAQVYQKVLDTLKYLIEMIKPGLSFEKLEDLCAEKISIGLIELGLLTKDKLNSNTNAYKPFMPHKVAHLIGLDVHESTIRPKLKAGMILAIEPAIYIPQEKLAIRLEENILITEKGCSVLSKDIPLEIQEIEQQLRKK